MMLGRGHTEFMKRLIILAVIGAGGCTLGGSDSAEQPAAQDAGTANDAAGTDGPSFEGGTDITGTWAQLLVYGTVFNLPAIGQTEGATTTIVRVSITGGTAKPSIEAETCTVEIDNGTDVIRTVIPDAFVEALAVQTPTATVDNTSGGLSYSQDRVLTLRGVKLTEPATEGLPTEANDPRVFDQDNDGNPGMTVLIQGITDGQVYVIQRDWYELEGQASGPDWIDGLATWNTEQVVLGSDNPILEMQTESSPHPDPSLSIFRMTRIDGAMDCKTIIAQRETLFAR